MSGEPLPTAPSADDFRALARSSPWRFIAAHFAHRRQRDGGDRAGEVVEAWLYRRARRVIVRSSHGVEVREGVPYAVTVSVAGEASGAENTAPPRQRPVLRPDGLIAERPDGWHCHNGDPMWRD